MLPVTSTPSQPSSVLPPPPFFSLLTGILYSVQTILGLSHLPSQPPEAMILPSVLTATSATPAFLSSTLYFFCSWPYRDDFINSAIYNDWQTYWNHKCLDTGYYLNLRLSHWAAVLCCLFIILIYMYLLYSTENYEGGREGGSDWQKEVREGKELDSCWRHHVSSYLSYSSGEEGRDIFYGVLWWHCMSRIQVTTMALSTKLW